MLQYISKVPRHPRHNIPVLESEKAIYKIFNIIIKAYIALPNLFSLFCTNNIAIAIAIQAKIAPTFGSRKTPHNLPHKKPVTNSYASSFTFTTLP